MKMTCHMDSAWLPTLQVIALRDTLSMERRMEKGSSSFLMGGQCPYVCVCVRACAHYAIITSF